MVRVLVIVVISGVLAACGGGTRNARGPAAAPVTLYATGPIHDACLIDGRRASSRVRCGCIQAVADMSLSERDQRRGAGYFREPHKLQQVRQSDGAGNERFWTAWKAYGERAAALCEAT